MKMTISLVLFVDFEFWIIITNVHIYKTIKQQHNCYLFYKFKLSYWLTVTVFIICTYILKRKANIHLELEKTGLFWDPTHYWTFCLSKYSMHHSKIYFYLTKLGLKPHNSKLSIWCQSISRHLFSYHAFPRIKCNSKCADNKQHMRREDFDTADQRKPHLCSPRQICQLISCHPAEGLEWFTSVESHPGQSMTDPEDLKDNFVL